MENAADALKMAFGVFVFIAALTLALSSFSKARETADTVLWYADETNYYSWTNSSDQKEGRKVGRDAVISSIYKKQTDTYVIVIISPAEKYIFTYNGKVTEVINGAKTTKDTNTVEHMNYYIEFVNSKLGVNTTYIENVSEVTNKGRLGGEYEVAEDGTKLQKIQGDSKVIVTYTKK